MAYHFPVIFVHLKMCQACYLCNDYHFPFSFFFSLDSADFFNAIVKI